MERARPPDYPAESTQVNTTILYGSFLCLENDNFSVTITFSEMEETDELKAAEIELDRLDTTLV